MPNKLCHVNLNVSVALWRKVNIFGIFEVQHANRRQIKYGIYNWKKDLLDQLGGLEPILEPEVDPILAPNLAPNLEPNQIPNLQQGLRYQYEI